MRITLIIYSLANGGAERVMSTMANYWAVRGEDITLITINSMDSDFYPLDSRIRRVALDLKRDSSTNWESIKNNLIRLARLRVAIKKSNPEVIISFLDQMNVLSLVATRGLALPVIVSEHIDPRKLPPVGIWKSLRRWTYSWASIVVVLTTELREVLTEFVSNDRLRVIPNAALSMQENTDAIPQFNISSPYMVAMGRLVGQKGFDYLLEAFSRCGHDEWSLIILGEGPERVRLEAMADQLGLGHRVHFPGKVNDPEAVLMRAELFVLSSRFEGFPMALIEAMSCGLPVVSFDCPTGPSEIIRNGHDGILVQPEDVEALAGAMNRLMEDKSERKRLGSHARDVTERFSIDKIMGLWDSTISEVLK